VTFSLYKRSSLLLLVTYDFFFFFYLFIEFLYHINHIKVNSLFVSGLRDLKWKISRKHATSSIQSSMDIYLE
jgi:hypothetical protein